MPDATARAIDWASARRRRWSGPRLAVAFALHAMVLVALMPAFDHVELARPGADRATTLVRVALHPAAPPARQAPATLRASAHAAARVTPAHAPSPPAAPDDSAHAITLPVAASAAAVAAATPPASTPLPDLAFLNSAATRQAIRAVARGDTLSSQANALTHEEPGSELVDADGSHTGATRNLPPPPPAQLLAQNIAAAHKGDCMKGEFLGGGMGLLSAPFLLAAEAMGKCAHK